MKKNDPLPFILYVRLDSQRKAASKKIIIKVIRGEEIPNSDREELADLEQSITACAKDLVDVLIKKHGGRCYENTIIWGCN